MSALRNELKNLKLWEDGMMDKIGTSSQKWPNRNFEDNQIAFLKIISTYHEEHKKIKLGGGTLAIEKQHNKKRLTARERIDHLIDSKTSFFEFGIYAAWQMYAEYGSPAASGTITGIGMVGGHDEAKAVASAAAKAGIGVSFI